MEYIHSKQIIHRDIKPDNFVIGEKQGKDTIFVIDFGLAKRFIDSKTGLHIPYKDHKGLTGTARYASLNTHLGIEQSRRDDLEGIGYVLMYFLRGSLPWQGLTAKNKQEKYEKIKNKKSVIEMEELCKGFPEQFIQYMNYCRKLGFKDKPDYEYLRSLFNKAIEKGEWKVDGVYDWVLTKPRKEVQKNKKKVNEIPIIKATKGHQKRLVLAPNENGVLSINKRFI